MGQTNFQIINASAGSGKTYALVLEYLKILLKNDSSVSFRQLLALTFTNKAVNEMKSRILKILHSLSNPPSKETHIVNNLCEALSISETELQFRADQILRKIFLEYGSFDIITIDKFNHRLVRTFSKEFQLPYNFEVVVDPSNLFDETVDSIIEEVGKVDTHSKLLLEFSLNKISNEKDWDIQKDLDDFIRLLLNENDNKPITEIKSKTSEELLSDRKLLEEALEKTKKTTLKHAKGALDFIASNGLVAEDFKRKQLYKHFEDVQKEVSSKLYDNQLETFLTGEKLLYNKTLAEEKKVIIDEIQFQLLAYFYKVKKSVGKHMVIKRTLNSWTPRMLLQLMEQRLDTLQSKKGIRLLGEFNTKISHVVQNEPAPYIYERLGERYQHYFLDEFQDTSELQCTNLIPLIGNALESENISGEVGSLLLVGDPKQAIYRWRGGNMKQFMDLINKSKNPFYINPVTFSLNQNFRSGNKITSFNNKFFFMLSKNFEKQEYKNIYSRESQQKTYKKGGYVRIEAITRGGTKESSTPLYISKTLTIVREALGKGYKESDLAILVRKKDQAAEIGKALSQEGLNLLSSESMLVAKSEKVKFLITFLKLSLNPDTSEYHKIILDVIWEIFNEDQEKYHKFALENLHKKTPSFLNSLEVYFDFTFKMEYLKIMSVFDAVNYILICFPQIDPNEAYIHFLVEDICEFSKNKTGSISSYLRYWKVQSKQLRISMPEGLEAIKLMTIHQAKGLEFPVVILPFMDSPVYPAVTEKIWFPFSKGKLERIKWGWFNFSKELQHFGKNGLELFKNKRLDQQLDSYNVLYVAMTRAVDALFVITKEVDNEGKTYAHYFKNYVCTQGKSLDALNSFEQGVFILKKQIIGSETKTDFKNKDSTLSLNIVWKKHLYLASSKDEIRKAQDWGLLIHNLLAKVTTSDLIPDIIQKAKEENSFTEELKNSVEEKLWEIVKHPKLKKFYEGKDRVLCETEILMPSGLTLRPDRINFSKSGKVSVLDYKTGSPKNSDIKQIKTYESSLQGLGYNQIDSYLIYINSEIQVVRKN